MNNTYKRIITAAALCTLLSVNIFAADGQSPASGPEEPAETEIILPRMYLEIEDLSIEEINAVIPDDAAVVLSSLELSLPEPDQIEIPAEAFALTDTAAPTSIPGDGSRAAQSSSFFSEGTIGAGTSAHIIGDINLYRIGEQPDLRLKYFHDSSDGFAGREAGEGYSSREELIEAELNYIGAIVSADILVSYNELEDGLQGQTDYFTVTRRIPEIAGSIVWQMSELFKLTGELDASIAGFQLNSALIPLGFNIFTLAPEAGLIFGTEQYNIGLAMKYKLAGQSPYDRFEQQFGGGLLFLLEPAGIFRVSGEIDILWNNFSSLYYPFELRVSGATSVFEYELSGGYRAEYTDRKDLWDIFPAAAGPESITSLGNIPITSGWFVGGGVRWNLSNMISLSADAGVKSMKNALTPVPSTLRGFNSLTTLDSSSLDLGIGMYMEITNDFSWTLDWDGQVLAGLDWFRPRHKITGGFEFTSSDQDMGIIGDAAFSIYDESQTWYTNDWLPALGLEAYVRLSDGFVLSISGDDLGAGLLGDGRNAWNGYLDKGTMLQAKIKISL